MLYGVHHGPQYSAIYSTGNDSVQQYSHWTMYDASLVCVRDLVENDTVFHLCKLLMPPSLQMRQEFGHPQQAVSCSGL